MPNQLANETSPYLLQHQDNPVNWYPWGETALERARSEDKPIFLSIGYSACHWCHVMEHESFESEAIATILNQHFVSIKVDREERPDLDQIYMAAVQMISGRGGWPMSVFLTPDLQPFFGGTYWPPEARMGMPGFDHVLHSVLDAWNNRRDVAVEQAAELTRRIAAMSDAETDDTATIDYELIRSAAVKLEQAFDFSHGGFGNAPKFPHSMNLQVLLRVWRREPKEGILRMVHLNLDKMAHGGIYDHLAGGFARYSVDARWLVPHFEKMLYDNGLLASIYLEAYLANKNEHYKQVVCETLDYILHYMTDAKGGFHSTEDADSEGEEGKFYVWTPEEIKQVLGPDRAAKFCYVYDVTEEGNFEGKNILNLPKTIEQSAQLKGWDLLELAAELKGSREELLRVRDQRIRPSKDDKVLVSWNGLMIDAMAKAGAAFAEPRFVNAARCAATFILEQMRNGEGRLWHTYRNGQAKLSAYLDDYTCFANSLISLYEATFDESWIQYAIDLMNIVLNRFRDEQGAFYFTADDHEQLIARTRDLFDSSVPSGSGMAAYTLIRLGRLTARHDYVDTGRSILKSAIHIMRESPTGAGQMLLAADLLLSPAYEIVLLGGSNQHENERLLQALRTRFLPSTVVAYRDRCDDRPASVLDAVFEGRKAGAEPSCFICEGSTCQEPIIGVNRILQRLDELMTNSSPSIETS